MNEELIIIDKLEDAPEWIQEDIMDYLIEDILDRYSNSSYWNENIIRDVLQEHGYKIKD